MRFKSTASSVRASVAISSVYERVRAGVVGESKLTLSDKFITELDAEGNEMWKVPPGHSWGTNLLGQALMAVRDDKE